jgi:nucleoside-diphosphate-sugar epimerase
MTANKATIVITGGAGFIGSHLCDALLAAGHRVVCIDNLLTGDLSNLQEAQKNTEFVFLSHDVSEVLSEEQETTLGNVTHIFHLASPASVIDYQTYPEQTAKVNSVGTLNMLALARRHNARFLFASTSEVYGDPKEHPQKETYWGNVNPNGIRSCYDESKRFGEAVTMVYARAHGVDVRIVRIFNTYGPRMRKTDGRVVSNFINQALEGKPMTVYGDGSQTRSFCFVSDEVAGLMKLMFADKAAGAVVNVGNPEEYAMIDLARKIKQMTGSASEIVFEPLPQDDPVKRKPDISKANALLDWEPVVTVDDGLAQTIAYYKKMV